MNKRIKKKKAKQAELRRQQELDELLQNPEVIYQGLQAISVLLANAFDSISIAFANMAKAVKRWEQRLDKEDSNQD
ncbi:hypothetical protein [Streptococcus suis]|uniref:hypothetical protein n=1 Tax=Streptococcus suis TaxID=1307 RepID=UPI001E04F484|nr:hypothetical protein [Streptococcus suis]MBS7976966.1 hypothetical protein [Streptococcus suis]HEM6460564.1 hypothetical protein [Streptococcus suis]